MDFISNMLQSLLNILSKSDIVEIKIGIECEVEIEYSQLEKFKYYCKNNDINIKEYKYTEKIVCKIEMDENKKSKILEDYKLKNINLLNLKILSKKYIEKSIEKK